MRRNADLSALHPVRRSIAVVYDEHGVVVREHLRRRNGQSRVTSRVGGESVAGRSPVERRETNRLLVEVILEQRINSIWTKTVQLNCDMNSGGPSGLNSHASSGVKPAAESKTLERGPERIVDRGAARIGEQGISESG